MPVTRQYPYIKAHHLTLIRKIKSKYGELCSFQMASKLLGLDSGVKQNTSDQTLRFFDKEKSTRHNESLDHPLWFYFLFLKIVFINFFVRESGQGQERARGRQREKNAPC